jgi:hypothetical protein
MIVLSAVVVGVTSSLFLVFLARRLHGTHPAARPQVTLSDEELANVSYHDIQDDMLKGIPSRPTLGGYAVIGGSGYLGT